MKMESKELFVLVVILFLAFAFRFVGAGVPVLNGDEADNVDAVLNIDRVSPWERWAGLLPPMAIWVMSFFVSLFGVAEWAVRLYGAVFGMLTVCVVFFLARLHFGVRTAVISAAYTAVMPLLVLSNRDAHPDNVLVFFTMLAVLFWEYGRLRSSWVFIFLGGLSAGSAVISKYNSVALFGFYWLFLLVTEWNLVKRFIAYLVFSIFVVVLVLFLSFGAVANVVYFAHGILFWLFNQSLEVTVPWYYSFSVLFDGLSPFFFVFLPLAAVRVRKCRNAWLHIVLCFFFLLLVTLQGRKFPRHFLLAVPFASIIIGVVLARWKTVVVALLLTTAAGVSVYKILEYQNHVVWRDVGGFLLENTSSDSVVYVDGVEHWPVNYYTGYQRRVVSKLHEELLKQGDIVLIHELNRSTPFFVGSPLQNDLTLFSSAYSVQYKFNEKFYDYALSHGKLLKRVSYDRFGNSVLIVGIESPYNGFSAARPKRALDAFTGRICGIWKSEGVLKKSMNFLLPASIKWQVGLKCANGCVVTCDIM